MTAPALAAPARPGAPQPTPAWAAWLETLVVTGLAPLIGWAVSRSDPTMHGRPFPWAILAPLLIGLRHGFARALMSAGVLCALELVHGRETSESTIEYCLGIVVVGMIAGEFTEVRGRRLRKAEASSEYRRARLGEFTRAYHLIRISHERLEQRLVGSTTSLREALLNVQRQLRETEVGSIPIREQGERILALFAGLGLLHVAALYEVESHGKLIVPAAARLGDAPELTSDPMIDAALERRQMLHLRAIEDRMPNSTLLAVVPLLDVDGRTWGLLAVHQMPFIAFHEANLKLLNVLAGYVADLLATQAAIPVAGDPDLDEFLRQLQRCIDDRRRNGLRSSVLGLVLADRAISDRLVEQIAHRWRRGLDVAWVLKNPTGAATIFILMPLTDMTGVRGYEARLLGQIRSEYVPERVQSSVTLHAFELEPGDRAETVVGRLNTLCGVSVVAPVRSSNESGGSASIA